MKLRPLSLLSGAWDHGLPRAAEVADLRLSLGEQAVLMLDESRLAELVATRAPCDTYLLYARRALASGTYWTVQVGDREHVRSSLGTFPLSDRALSTRLRSSDLPGDRRGRGGPLPRAARHDDHHQRAVELRVRVVHHPLVARQETRAKARARATFRLELFASESGFFSAFPLRFALFFSLIRSLPLHFKPRKTKNKKKSEKTRPPPRERRATRRGKRRPRTPARRFVSFPFLSF